MRVSIHDDVKARLDLRETTSLCKLGKVLATLPGADRDALNYALKCVAEDFTKPQHVRVFTIKWIETLLNSHGFSIGKTVISNHLAGTCACDKSGS